MRGVYLLLLSLAVLTSAGAAGQKSDWKPDPRLVLLLGPEATVGGYRFHPPKGYTARVLQGPQTLYAWEAPARTDGTHAALTMMVLAIPPADTRAYTADAVLDRFLGAVKRRREHWAQIPTQSGEIGGIRFARTRWVGTDAATFKKMAGFQYAAVDGRTIIVMASQDLEREKTALQLAETSLLTLRRIEPGKR